MPHVAIVGAGPAGAALAYLLARRAMQVTLLERQTDFEREFRGEVLMPSGIAMFRQMGLEGPFDALPHSQISRADIYFNRRQALTVGTDSGNGARVVPQPAMLEMLVSQASRYPSFAFERGATVRELLRDGGRVAGITADTVSGPREIRADFVIGTDGRTSVVRKRASLDEEHNPQRFDVVWFKIPAPNFIAAGTARAYLGFGHLLLAYLTPDAKLQVAWVINKGTFGDIRRMGVDGWLDAMASYTSADFSAHLIANRASLSHPFLLDVKCDRLTRWSAPGVMLLGDAAHPMSPVGGQGINVALRDAIVAANHLLPALTAGGAERLDEAARRTQDERMPEIVQIQNLQQFGPSILFGGHSVIARLLFSPPMMALVRTKMFQSLIAGRFGAFFNGVAPVELRERI